MSSIVTPGAAASDRVYADVRERILAGRLRGGDVVSEVELAAEHGVSRTPVHEAFVRLQADDFLAIRARRGAVVVPVGQHEARDILELRLALEVAAVRRLAATDSVGARASLAEEVAVLLEEQAVCVEAGDVVGFAVADERFHRALVSASGNVLTLRAYTDVADRQRRMTVHAVGGRPERLGVLLAEHRELADLVLAGRPETFESALIGHLAATHDHLLGAVLPAPREGATRE